MKTTALIIFILATFVAGCSLLQRVDTDSLQSWLLVDQSTGRFIEASGDRQTVRAQAVSDGAAKLIGYIDAEKTLTLPELRSRVEAEIPWDKLNPSDKRLLQALAAHYVSDIDAAASAANPLAEELIQLRQVFVWAKMAADSYL